MRVAIYTRISPNPNKKDTVNQLKDLEEFAKRNDWEIVKRFEDINISAGGKVTRPAFRDMMKEASQKQFDLVLFWSLDRLSREGVYQTITYLNQLNKWGVEYKSYTEQYLDSCGVFKDAVIAIMATIAKQERIRLVERTVAGLETAKARGIKLGRAYSTVATPTRPNPVNIEEVKRLREQGLSLSKIGKKVKASVATISRIVNGVGVYAEKN